MSAILVKIPPAIRRADAPRDSPMAKPRKQYPDDLAGNKEKDDNHHYELKGDQEKTNAHAGAEGNVHNIPGLSGRATRKRCVRWRRC